MLFLVFAVGLKVSGWLSLMFVMEKLVSWQPPVRGV
jgi:hypothetical protein